MGIVPGKLWCRDEPWDGVENIEEFFKKWIDKIKIEGRSHKRNIKLWSIFFGVTFSSIILKTKNIMNKVCITNYVAH